MTNTAVSPEITDHRVAILLSTHNGIKYLGELLDSIAHQQYTHWDLWVRDDGSEDDTISVLHDFREKMARTHPNNRVYLNAGENIGVVYSFFSLFSDANGPYIAYAFCDQDDIWLPEKLQRAVDHLKVYRKQATGRYRPWLYHSRQLLIDGSGKVYGNSPLPYRTGFYNAVIQNQVVGCTMMVNEELRNLFLSGYKSPLSQKKEEQTFPGHTAEPIIMHDWWCYLLVSAFGDIVYDSEPSIKFRRHETSATPVTTTRFRAWMDRATAMNKRTWSISHILDQAEAFYLRYVPEDQTLSDSLLSLIALKKSGYVKRLRYVIRAKHHRSTRLETLMFRILVFMGR